MNKILPILCIFLFMGCANLSMHNKYTFTTGRYILELSSYDQERYIVDLLIENRSGNLEFINPYNGEIILSGLLENNMFLASVYEGVTHMNFRGKLISDNHMEGKTNGRVMADPNRGYPADSLRKEDTILKEGKMILSPYNVKSSKEVMSFLPIIDAPGFWVSQIHNPRTYEFILAPNAKLFDFKDVVFNPAGNTIVSYKKQAITIDDLEKNIERLANKWGVSIPIEIYADKNITISLIDKILKNCQKLGVYIFYIRALQNKWEGLYRIPIKKFVEKSIPDELELSIQISKNAVLINGGKKANLEKHLAQIAFNDPKQIIAITYTENATIQELLPILVLCKKSDLGQVYLKGGR